MRSEEIFEGKVKENLKKVEKKNGGVSRKSVKEKYRKWKEWKTRKKMRKQRKSSGKCKELK
jgi:hypothetical protein